MDSFAVAVNRFIFHSDQTCPISDIMFVPDSWWIQATARATESMRQQTYFYNLVEGCFLVDGKPIGQLPAEHRESIVLRDLFGNLNLLTVPSRLHGMTHAVAHNHHSHEVHFGFREGLLFVRAVYHRTVLEFVPQQRFISSTQEYDLPAPLVDNCVHWLNVATGEVEVRVRPDIWRSKKNNWKINLQARIATRDSRTLSTLINPFSRLFRRVAGIFAHFEDSKNLAVSQSWSNQRSPILRVELRRLELTFSVNKNGLLESPQLRSEIDPNQDAGTWYGLMSSLILRNVANHSRRMVIVPLGSLKCARSDFHAAIYVQNIGKYGCFTINETLGRIECPPEPLLSYSKAMFHAFTSFVTPDPLTGRIGTEESFHCLKSGSSSPWIPLNKGPIDVLFMMAALVPFRAYYPKSMKVMERVTWNSDLPFTIQHDGFLPILNAILDKSRMLALFSPSSVEIPIISSTETHLSLRAFHRRVLFERPWESRNTHHTPDAPYRSRHICRPSQARGNVFEVTTLLVSRPAMIQTSTPISTIMASWKDVGGFSQPFASPFLSDILNACPDRDWGSLVRLCHQSDADRDTFELVFVLALLAFRDDIPMDLIRVLVAFAIYPEFKELDLPRGPSFVQYRYHRAPSVDMLVLLMRPHVSTELEAIARCFLEQWPCEEPSILEFPPFKLVNLSEALESVRPEWYRLYQNWQLSTLIDLVQERLRSRQSDRAIPIPDIPSLGQNVSHSQDMMSWRPFLSELLSRARMDDYGRPLVSDGDLDTSAAVRRDGCNSQAMPPNPPSIQTPSDPVSRELHELHDVVRDFGQSESTIKKKYAAALMNSIESFRQKSTETDTRVKLANNNADILQSLHASRARLHDRYRRFTQSLEGGDLCCRWLKLGGIWPAVTPITLLEELRSISPISYDVTVKEALVAYGVSISETQRFVRMEDSRLQGDTLRLEQDRRNPGHLNWNPLDHPDWLLFEIDSNILLRPKQSDVATATIWPPSQENSVLQMNMGEGTTRRSFFLRCADVARRQNLLYHDPMRRDPCKFRPTRSHCGSQGAVAADGTAATIPVRWALGTICHACSMVSENFDGHCHRRSVPKFSCRGQRKCGSLNLPPGASPILYA